MDGASQTFALRDRVLQKYLLRVRPAALAALIKKLLRVKRRVIATEAGRFYVDPVSGFGALLALGPYEPELAAALRSLLGPGGSFVDVGANEGYFSVIASKLVGASGRVLAVEPQRRLRTILEKNFELNAVANVEIAEVAISDRRGSATLHLSPDTNTGSTALEQTTRYATQTASIETCTLEEFLATHELERVDLMKMDIEGFEYEAILGSPEVFRKHRVRALALELHGRMLVARGRAPEDIASFLQSCGYQVDRSLDQPEGNAVWIAP